MSVEGRQGFALAVGVFAVSALLLGWRLGEIPLGAGELVAGEGVNAQDEAVYTHAALTMVERGDWITPRFLGRYFLYKPPLVYWSGGLSAWLFGEQAWAVRLPAVAASAGVCAIVFREGFRHGGSLAGAAAWLVLLACPLWVGLARRNLTDPLYCFGLTLAAVAASRIGSRAGSWAFAAGVATAILAKGAAGAVPVAIAIAVWVVAGKQRPSSRSIVTACARAAAVAAPWFVWQGALHWRWFFEEFVRVELLAWGMSNPPQITRDPAWLFYGRHLAGEQGLALLAAGIGLVWALRRDWREAVLPLAWIVILGAALAGYAFRHATYLMPLIPAMAILVSRGPRWSQWAWLAAAPLLVAGALAANHHHAAPGTAIALLAEHDKARRPNPLLVIGTGDHFHAALVRRRGIRYALEEASFPSGAYALDFRAMGIAVSVDEFLDLERHRERFERKQREWALDDTSATASVILYRDRADLDRLIAGRSEFDTLDTTGATPRLSLGRPTRRIAATDHR
jgi:hypothetical protein